MTMGLAVIPAPVSAQQVEVAVFGTDPCPRSTESQIVVCKHYPEASATASRVPESPGYAPAAPVLAAASRRR